MFYVAYVAVNVLVDSGILAQMCILLLGQL